MASSSKPVVADGTDLKKSLLTRRRAVAITIALSGSFIASGFLQRQYRARRAAAMQQSALRELVMFEQGVLAGLTGQAADQIKLYFAGACLNSHRFTAEVCSLSYAEKLRSLRTREAQQQLLNSTLNDKLISVAEISNEIDRIINAASDALDKEWKTTCQKIDHAWKPLLQGAPQSFSIDVHERTRPLILEAIRQARTTTHTLADRPAVGETAVTIGIQALRLIPLASFGPKVFIPAFLMAALSPLWQFIWGQLAKREYEYREALTKQLSLLAGQVTTECQSAFEERIANLILWQKRALEQVGSQLARSTVNLLG